MSIGTRSVLYGAHCFFIHPFFVALAWWKLYGFPWDPRLWVAFFVHDLGYWGKPNLDGEEGELHPTWGAEVMWFLFDTPNPLSRLLNWVFGPFSPGGQTWWRFVYYHSRFLAKRDGAHYSLLCVADKLAILEPWWLYLPRVIATGEIHEYMRLSGVMNPQSKYAGEPPVGEQPKEFPTYRAWHRHMTNYVRAWVEEHRDGRQDTWTPTTVGKRPA